MSARKPAKVINSGKKIRSIRAFSLRKFTDPIYSVRVSIGWRAVGIIDADTIVWFWIGSHGDYDKLLASL